jgi:hypothetical protein
MEKYHEKGKNTDVAARCCTYSEHYRETARRENAERLLRRESAVSCREKCGFQWSAATERSEYHRQSIRKRTRQ